MNTACLQASFLAVAQVAAALVECPGRAEAVARQGADLRLLQGVARLVHGNAQRTYHYILRLDGAHFPLSCEEAETRLFRPSTSLAFSPCDRSAGPWLCLMPEARRCAVHSPVLLHLAAVLRMSEPGQHARKFRAQLPSPVLRGT